MSVLIRERGRLLRKGQAFIGTAFGCECRQSTSFPFLCLSLFEFLVFLSVVGVLKFCWLVYFLCFAPCPSIDLCTYCRCSMTLLQLILSNCSWRHSLRLPKRMMVHRCKSRASTALILRKERWQWHSMRMTVFAMYQFIDLWLVEMFHSHLGYLRSWQSFFGLLIAIWQRPRSNHAEVKVVRKVRQ